MKVSAMGKQRKGMGALLRKACSVAVAVCMTLTLTPAAAWATVSNGTSVGESGQFVGSSDGSAAASSEVKARVYDENFRFISLDVHGSNFTSVSAFESAINAKPMEAKFNTDGLPDNFTVTWYATEMVYNEDTGTWKTKEKEGENGKPVADAVSLFTQQYENKQNVPADGSGVPTFQCPSSGGAPDLSSLEQGKKYEISVVLQNNDLMEGDINKSTSIRDYITIYENYKMQFIVDETHEEISVGGDIYVNGTITGWTAPTLSAAPVEGGSGSVLAALNEEAQSASESVESATQLDLKFTSSGLPPGVNPYVGELEVALQVPSGLGAIESDSSGNPVVTLNDGTKTSTVSVYVYDATAKEVTKQTGMLEWAKDPDVPYKEDGTPNYLVDEYGNKVPVVVATIEGTGVRLGTFGVGIPTNVSETCTIVASSGEYGSITPAGTRTVPLESEQSFGAYALAPGYLFTGFTVEVGGDKKDVSGSEGFNTLTFTPSKYAANGQTINITANFELQDLSAGSHSLTVKLSREGNAAGSLDVAATTGTENASATVQMNKEGTITIPAQAGAMLTFSPETVNPQSRVKSAVVTSGGRKGEVAVEGSMLMIGALSANTVIEVIYEEGAPIAQVEKSVEVSIPVSYGNQPAWLSVGDENLSTHTYGVDAGGYLTVNVKNNASYEYDLVRVWVTEPDGTEKAIFAKSYKESGEEGYCPSTYEDPETDTLKAVVSDNGTGSDYGTVIKLYNVVDSIKVKLEYLLPKASVSGELEGEGDFWWSEPETVKSVSAVSDGLDGGVSVYSGASVVSEDITQNKKTELEVGQRIQLHVVAKSGYTVGSVSINGEDVTKLLTYRGEGDLYTVTVYRGELSVSETMGKDYSGDGVYDQVYCTSVKEIAAKIVLNPVAIPVETFHMVSTSVTAFGGGSITPSRKVAEGGSTTISFFPDEGYKVQNVWVDGMLITADGWIESNGVKWLDSNHSGVVLSNVGADMAVKVSFTAGEQSGGKSKVTVTATAGAGGSISPSGSYQVYAGTEESFVITPSTGYKVSEFTVDGKSISAEDSTTTDYKELAKINNVYTMTVNADTDIRVTFEKKDNEDRETYTVNASVVEGEGAISPSSQMTVGAGSSMTFTILPKYEADGEKWYIKDVCVRYGSADSAAASMMGLFDKSRFSLTLSNIRDDSFIEVTFAKSENGNYPGTDDPVPNPNDEAGTWKPGSGTITVDPDGNPGAAITPSIDDMEFVEDSDTGGIVGSLNFTVTVADGYELASPVLADSEGIGGIVVKSEGSCIGKSEGVEVTPVADGLYIVSIPGKYVNDDLQITVNTNVKETSTEASDGRWTIETKVTGSGVISPEGTANKVLVENGRNQTFSFIPADGYKLHTVYVTEGDGASTQSKQVSVTNSTYTVVNVRSNMKIEAVFAELEDGETQPQIKTHTVNIISDRANIDTGTFSPQGAVEVVDGSSLTISANPVSGFKVSAKLADGTELTKIGNSFEVANITKDLTVNISFSPEAQSYCNFVVSSSGPGVTSPSGIQLVPSGSSQTVYFIPDEGKYLKSVTVNEDSDAINDVDASTMSLALSSIDVSTSVVVEYCDESTESDRPGLPAGGSAFVATMYNVTASVDGGVGGVVSPASAKVAQGKSLTLTVISRAGYEVEAVYDNGTAISSSMLADVKANGYYEVQGVASDRSISVKFRETQGLGVDPYYTVIASVSSNSSLGETNGGSISPAGATVVAGGGSFTLTLMPEPGCKVKNVIVNGARSDFSGSSYTLFSITEDTTIEVAFAKLDSGEQGSSTLTHDIEASSTVGGSVSPEGTIKVADGKNAAFTFVPSSGYKFSYVRVDGVDVDASDINNNQYIFSGVTSDHSIHAVFCKDDASTTYQTVTATAGRNGIISPEGSVLVESGSTQTVQIAGYYGYKVSDIVISVGGAEPGFSLMGQGSLSSTITGAQDGVSYSWSGSTLTLMNVVKDVVVSAQFESTYTGSGTQPAPGFTQVTGGTSSNPASSNASGSLSVGDGGYTEDPSDWDSLDESDPERHPQVTVVPDEGSVVDKITISYGDGSKTVIDENGTTKYDKDGNVTRSYPEPTALDVQEDGYFSYDAERADEAGGVDFDVTFRPATDADSSLETPTYYEVNVTYSGGGSVFSKGRVKVAEGSKLMLQMLPQDGYEVASITLDGKNVIDSMTSTRKLFVDGDDNHSVNVVFAYVNSASYKTVEAVVSDGGGKVSPGRVEVSSGSNVSISFYPESGKKIERLTVIASDGTSSNLYDGAYSLPVYTISDIQADYTVTVSYCNIPNGETSWSAPETRTLTARAGDGNGSVSPETQLVSKGSSGAVYFKPNDGYQVDYIIFNDVVTTLYGNPAYYNVTPKEGKANEVIAYFKPVTADSQSYVTVNTTADTHAAAYPQSTTVKTGDRVNIYIYPDSGYTIDSVTVNGWSVSARPAVPSGQATSSGKAYSAYVVTIDDVQPESGQDYATVNVTTKLATGMQREEVSSHKLTITGQNALTLSPFGEMMVPEGYAVNVYTTAIAGHYLDSATATEVDSSGNAIGRAVDLYGRIQDGSFEYTMGSNDTEIFIKYLPVGENRPSMVNVSLAGAQFDDGNGNLTDMDLSKVSIGTAQMPDGTVVPISLGEDGVLMSNGSPMEFKRGSSYTFFASAVDDEGNQLLLTSATYDGAQLDVGSNDNTIYNVLLNTSADMHLVFRELKEGETIEVYKRYTVWAEVANGIGGSITGIQSQSVAMGGSSDPFVFTPESDYWMIKCVDLLYYDDADNMIGADYDINPALYYDETFVCTGVYANTRIVVTFCEASLIDVAWDNSQGYITPNPGTKYLKVPASYETVNFIIAPYQGYYVKNVTAEVGNSGEVDVTNQLVQSQEAAERLCSQGKDYSVVAVTEGAGVVSPTDDEESTVTDGADTQVSTQSGEVVTAAFTSSSATSTASLDNRNGVTPSDTVFARAYAYEMSVASDNALTASFYQAKASESYYIITAIAGEHGSIALSSSDVLVSAGASKDIQVAAGYEQLFYMIPDEGYAVSDVKVDGLSVGAKSSYSVTADKDHTIEVSFVQLTEGGLSGLVKTASGLAKTGDLTGPVVGFFLLIAALGIGVMAISMIRSKRHPQRVRRVR